MGLQSTSYDVEMERNHPKPFKLNSKVNIRHFWSHHPSHFKLHLVSTTDRKDTRAKCMLTSPKVLWTDDTKLELFGHSDQFYVYRWKNDALKENNTSLLKGLGVVGLGHLAQWTCAGHNEQPRLPRWKILQWDNGPKPKKANSTQERLRNKHWTILKWPSTSRDLRIAVWRHCPSKEHLTVTQEEWAMWANADESLWNTEIIVLEITVVWFVEGYQQLCPCLYIWGALYTVSHFRFTVCSTDFQTQFRSHKSLSQSTKKC